MSSAEPGLGGGGAWPSNETNSAAAASGPETADRDFAELPTKPELLREIEETYPERAALPICNTDGQKLREEAVVEVVEVEEWAACPVCAAPAERGCDHNVPMETGTVERVVERRAATWIEVAGVLLESYEDYRYLRLRLRKGDETFTIPLTNSWQPEYQREQFAKLKGLERQVIGYETCVDCNEFYCSRPAEHDTEFRRGKQADPYTVIVTRTASSTPGGGFIPPVEHDRAIADSWPQVKRATRYALEDVLGLEPGDWEYHRQSEPHTSGGPASCYAHEHIILLIDAAPLELSKAETEAVLRTALEPVIEKHVEETPGAKMAAHPLDHDDPKKQALSVKRVGPEEGDVSYPSSYAAKYLGLDEFDDLYERSPEYIMWAASQWATNTQKATRSDGANAAIAADRCKQRYHSPESVQQERHGEVVREAADGARHDLECWHCGSPFEINQESEAGTLAEARLDDGRPAFRSPKEAAAAVVAGPELVDGRDVPVVTDGGEETGDGLRARWSDARAAASVGESTARVEQRRRIERFVEGRPEESAAEVAGALLLPPSADELVEDVLEDRPPPGGGFERPGEWEADAIVDDRRRECLACGHRWLALEGEECPRCGEVDIGPAEYPPTGDGVDMKELLVPGQRVEAALGGVEQTLYTCDCGMTMGPASVVNHLIGHGLAEEPERAASMIEPTRG